MALLDAGSGRKIIGDNRFQGGCVTVLLAGTVQIGDPIGFSTGWKKADADTGPIKAQYIACQEGVSGDTINVCTDAIITGVTATTGITGGTAGLPVYIGATGLWVEAVLSGSTNDNTPYGVTLDAYTIHVVTMPGLRGNTVVP